MNRSSYRYYYYYGPLFWKERSGDELSEHVTT